MKARGDGLSLPFDRFTVTLAPGDAPRLLSVDGRPGEEGRWELRELEPCPGGIGALAVAQHGVTLRWFEYHFEIGMV